MIAILQTLRNNIYCGWKKSCTILDGWNPVNNGISHLSNGALRNNIGQRFMNLCSTFRSRGFQKSHGSMFNPERPGPRILIHSFSSDFWYSQWPFQGRLIGGTDSIYKAYYWSLCKGISQQNMALYGSWNSHWYSLKIKHTQPGNLLHSYGIDGP